MDLELTIPLADSFALYALLKAVQKALGNKYPYLPRPYNGQELDDGPNGRKKWPPHSADASDHYSKLTWSKDSLLGYFIEDLVTNCTSGDDVDTCPAVIEVSKLIEDWKYPKEYLDKRTGWLKDIEGHIGKKAVEQKIHRYPATPP